MSVILPPNSTGTTVATVTSGGKDYPVGIVADPQTPANQAGVHLNPNGIVSGDAGMKAILPETWSVVHTPTTATQATITKGAAGSGIRHVCQAISFAVAVDGSHAQTAIQINLRDGTTGAGTVLWSQTVFMAATEPMHFFGITGLRIFGSAATAMTLEFSAAGVTGSLQSVSLTGYDVGAT